MPLFCLRHALVAEDKPVFEVTFLGGAPIQKVVQSNICCSASVFAHQEIDHTNYIAGVSVGVILPNRLGVEFGAMYMPLSFRTTTTTCCPPSNVLTPTHNNVWEFPALASYRWAYGPFRPFAGGGIIVHNTIPSSFDQSAAPVLRGGIEAGIGRLSIRPEFRYIHYPGAPGPSDLRVSRPSTQMQVLVGVGFRVY